jgi:hypothetical protein
MTLKSRCARLLAVDAEENEASSPRTSPSSESVDVPFPSLPTEPQSDSSESSSIKVGGRRSGTDADADEDSDVGKVEGENDDAAFSDSVVAAAVDEGERIASGTTLSSR